MIYSQIQGGNLFNFPGKDQVQNKGRLGKFRTKGGALNCVWPRGGPFKIWLAPFTGGKMGSLQKNEAPLFILDFKRAPGKTCFSSFTRPRPCERVSPNYRPLLTEFPGKKGGRIISATRSLGVFTRERRDLRCCLTPCIFPEGFYIHRVEGPHKEKRRFY